MGVGIGGQEQLKRGCCTNLCVILMLVQQPFTLERINMSVLKCLYSLA